MENTEVKISKILKQLGIYPNILGYVYLKEAIDMVLKDDSVLRKGVTKILYPEVAKKFQANAVQVERAIRHAVHRACNKGDIKLMEEIFGYNASTSASKPTNSEFIACITEYVALIGGSDA